MMKPEVSGKACRDSVDKELFPTSLFLQAFILGK